MSISNFERICINGDIDIVQSMIEYLKLNDSYTKQYRNYGLYGACIDGHLDIIELLTKDGVTDLNWGLGGACQGGNLKIIDLMIRKGANDWDRGLCGACHGGHLNIIDLMIKKGANHWDWGLQGACEGGHSNIVKMMIEYGALRFNWGLVAACDGKQLDMIRLMIEYGAGDLSPIFDSAFDMINSDIVSVIVRKQISLEPYLKYPEDMVKIFKLCELGLPVDFIKYIDGFGILERVIEGRRHIVKYILSKYLINDLIGIVSGYVIN